MRAAIDVLRTWMTRMSAVIATGIPATGTMASRPMAPPSIAPVVRHLRVLRVSSRSQTLRSCCRSSAKPSISRPRLRASFSTFFGSLSSRAKSLTSSSNAAAPASAGRMALSATASPTRRIGSVTASGTASVTRLAAFPATSPVRPRAVLAQFGRPRGLSRLCQCSLSLSHTCFSYALIGIATSTGGSA